MLAMVLSPRLSPGASPRPPMSCPRKRAPSTPQHFILSADVGVYWFPAFAGMTVVRVERRCFCGAEAAKLCNAFRPGTAGPSPLLDDLSTRPDVIPAKAGIQYAAVPHLVRRHQCLLGPGFRRDDGSAGGEEVLLRRRSGQALQCFRTGTAGPLPLLDALSTSFIRHASESGHPVRRSASSCPQRSAFTGSRLSPGRRLCAWRGGATSGATDMKSSLA